MPDARADPYGRPHPLCTALDRRPAHVRASQRSAPGRQQIAKQQAASRRLCVYRAGQLPNSSAKCSQSDSLSSPGQESS